MGIFLIIFRMRHKHEPGIFPMYFLVATQQEIALLSISFCRVIYANTLPRKEVR